MRTTAGLAILFGSCEGHLTRGTEQDGYTSCCPHDLYVLHLHKHVKEMFTFKHLLCVFVQVKNIKIMRATAGLAILFGSCEGHLTRFRWRPWVHLTGSNAWVMGHLKLGLYIGLYRFSNSVLRIDGLKCKWIFNELGTD
ncbi:hypothetical protein V6N13_099741 [Hibiscus sabdariffa]